MDPENYKWNQDCEDQRLDRVFSDECEGPSRSSSKVVVDHTEPEIVAMIMLTLKMLPLPRH